MPNNLLEIISWNKVLFFHLTFLMCFTDPIIQAQETYTPYTIRIDISRISNPDWFNTMYIAESTITNWQFKAMNQESENVYYYSDTILEGTTIRPTFSYSEGWGTSERAPICAQEGNSSRTQTITSANNDFTFFWDEYDCEDQVELDILNAKPTANILFSKDNLLGTVEREVLGQGLIYDKEPDSLWSAPEGLLFKEVKNLSSGILRYPGGVGTNYYHWNNPTGTYKDDNWNPNYNTSNNIDPDYWMSVDEYLSLCTEMGTIPLLGVNIESGLVYNREQDGIDEAVSLVEHTKDLGFEGAYYYLGNEPYVLDNNEVDLSATEYANRFLSYAIAIKNADPTAKTILNWHRYIAEKTEELHEIFQIAGEYIDVVDFHWYWENGTTSFAEWRNQQGMRTSVSSLGYIGGTYEEDAKAFKDTMSAWGYEDVKLASLEYNIGKGNSFNYPSESEVSLMVGEMLLQFINGSVDIACLWPMHFPFQYYSEYNNARTLFAENRALDKNALYDVFHFLKDVPGRKLIGSYSNNEWVYGLAVVDSVSGEVELYLLNRADSPISGILPLTADLFEPGNLELSSILSFVEGENYRADTSEGFFNLSNGDVSVELPAFSITRIALPPTDSLYKKQSYNVEFEILDKENGLPVSNCTLDFNGMQLITDDQGKANLVNLDYGEYSLSLLANGYGTRTINRIEIISDSSFTFYMTEENNEFSVTLKVLDRASGIPVNRAIVNFNNELGNTNSSGELFIDKMEMCEMIYSIEHSDYFVFTSSSVIASDTILIIELTRKLADIQFEVSNSEGPISNASVKINDYSISTDFLGVVFMDKQPARVEYRYSIQESGYKFVEDTFFLEIDTIIKVLLEPATGLDNEPLGQLKIYPNPVSDILYIKSTYLEAQVSLISLDGKTVLKKLLNENGSIDISGISEGYYFLKVQTKSISKSFKMLIIR
ncbi:MAG: T9SS type A sorting domain-containing protein [Bacteroidales bacterium]|nr:T9SS type A sorting domain-containing protein [Bacteroidales bacterium]